LFQNFTKLLDAVFAGSFIHSEKYIVIAHVPSLRLNIHVLAEFYMDKTPLENSDTTGEKYVHLAGLYLNNKIKIH
jgi:hypothetical protein